MTGRKLLVFEYLFNKCPERLGKRDHNGALFNNPVIQNYFPAGGINMDAMFPKQVNQLDQF